LRILYFIDSLNIGGAEMLLVSMLRTYQPDHDMHVVYFTEGPLRAQIEEMGIPLTRISTRGIKDPTALPKAIQLARTFKPDVIHTHLSKSDIVGQMAGSMLGVPVRISTIHNTDPWRMKALPSTFMKQVTGGAQKMIAVSTVVRDYVIEHGNLPPEKIVVVDNGIDLDKFDPATVTPVDLNAEYGIDPDAPIVSVIGRLHPQKGHEYFLQSAKMIVDEMPEARLLIVGDGDLREGLEARRTELGLDDHVIFTGIRRDMPNLMAATDIVAFSSLYEGLPVTLLEAMAMERVLVSTAVGGVPDVVVDHENGLLVPVEDAGAFAKACLEALRDADLRQSLGKAARETIRQSFDQRVMHQQILDMYTEILQQS
jgi:glycosyltransferase involved in cell wall biosynthesis